MIVYTYVPTVPNIDFGMIFYNGDPIGQYGTAADVDQLNAGIYGWDVSYGGRSVQPAHVLPVAPVSTAIPALPPKETVTTVFIPWDANTMSLQTVANSLYFEPTTVIDASVITPSAFPYDASNTKDKASYTATPIAYMAQHSGNRWTPKY